MTLQSVRCYGWPSFHLPTLECTAVAPNDAAWCHGCHVPKHAPFINPYHWVNTWWQAYPCGHSVNLYYQKCKSGVKSSERCFVSAASTHMWWEVPIKKITRGVRYLVGLFLIQSWILTHEGFNDSLQYMLSWFVNNYIIPCILGKNRLTE